MASSTMSILWKTTFSTRHLQLRNRTTSSPMSLKTMIYDRLRKKRHQEELAKSSKNTESVVGLSDSLLTQQFIRDNPTLYTSISRAETKFRKDETQNSDSSSPDRTTSYPYHLSHDPKIFSKATPSYVANNNQNAEMPKNFAPDKGFYVKGKDYVDEYTAGTAADLPNDEMNECPYHFFGSENAVETVDFQLPGQMSNSVDKFADQTSPEEENDEWKLNYSQAHSLEDIKVKSQCSGCGAAFHCNDSALPGYVPIEVIRRVADQEAKNARRKSKVDIAELCRRCYMLKNYDFLLNVNVCEVDYTKIMGHLKLVQEALILLVVDMTDIQGSIYRQLSDIIGTSKPMIVVGNKVDLLPPDARPGYLKNFRTVLNDALNESGLNERFNIMHTAIVSAKTGYGIEDLITNIYLKWMNPKGSLRSDIYIVGCTNAGKSTLFNTFLQSDLCKVRASDLVERVTTSVWPGTTLSLLKFPLMNPSSFKLELRRRRLLSLRAWSKKEEYIKKALYDRTKDPKYLMLSGIVDNSLKEHVDEHKPMTSVHRKSLISNEADPEAPPPDLFQLEKPNAALSDPEFTQGNWCFDSPGTVTKDQILELFTLEELINVIPRSLIKPRVAILHGGQTLLLGGVARIDVLTAATPIFLTAFCSDRLPIRVMWKKDVPKFMEKFNGTSILAVPAGDEERLKKFPPLSGTKFVFDGSSGGKASADIVLSSIGWVSVTSGNNDSVQLRAMTPGGKGIYTRNPILPYAANYRGARIMEDGIYQTKPLCFEHAKTKSAFRQKRHRKF